MRSSVNSPERYNFVFLHCFGWLCICRSILGISQESNSRHFCINKTSTHKMEAQLPWETTTHVSMNRRFDQYWIFRRKMIHNGPNLLGGAMKVPVELFNNVWTIVLQLAYKTSGGVSLLRTRFSSWGVREHLPWQGDEIWESSCIWSWNTCSGSSSTVWPAEQPRMFLG
jgi:hypothetical protein